MHTETENEREVAREKEIHIEKGEREREKGIKHNMYAQTGD